MIVDTHMHLLADDTTRYPIAPIGGQQSEWSKGRHLTPEQFLDHMRAAGVDQATLVQASTVHGYDNNYTADSAAKYPDRFVGVCCIDPLQPDAPDTLSHWVKDRGMRGLRLFTVGTSVAESRWLDDPQTFSTWQRCGELGIPVDAQIRSTGVDMLINILERYPNVTVLLDHLGGPKVEDGAPFNEAKWLLDLSRYNNLYLKFSTNNIREAEKGKSTAKDFFRALIDRYGPNRLLWGTNFPGTSGSAAAPYQEIVQYAKDTLGGFLSSQEFDLVMGENARTLYPDLKRAG